VKFLKILPDTSVIILNFGTPNDHVKTNVIKKFRVVKLSKVEKSVIMHSESILKSRIYLK